MQSPIYNCSNFAVQPKPCDCRKCGAKTMIAKRKTGQWFTVDQTSPGQWQWHICKDIKNKSCAPV